MPTADRPRAGIFHNDDDDDDEDYGIPLFIDVDIQHYTAITTRRTNLPNALLTIPFFRELLHCLENSTTTTTAKYQYHLAFFKLRRRLAPEEILL